jgi:drug/metabolite transporter (DMT)-like permease
VNARSFAQLLLLGALWGAAFMFMRVAAPEFGAVPMAAARVGLACVMMLLVVAALRQSLDFRARWKTYLGIGAVNTAIPFIAYCFAALHIPAGYSAIGNSTTPVWGALIAWLWFKERLGPLKWLGIVFAFSGVLALVGLQPVALTPMVLLGMLAVVLAAAMYATASFLISRYLKGQSGLASATGMVWGATVWLALPGIWLAPAVLPSAQALGALFALSLFCTVVGYIVFFNLIKTIGPQRASSVAFLFPAFAAFWGWLVLSEPITLNMIAGMALVLVGTALVSMGAPGATKHGPVTAWERLRDQVLLPMAFALSPMLMRRPLAAWIRANPNVFRIESAALLANIHTLLPTADAHAAAADLRLTRVADYADLWVSLTRSDAWMQKHVRATVPEQIDTPALFVTFHYGGGWWITRYLRTLGKPIAIVMQRGGDAQSWPERVVLAFGTLRMKAIERVCAAPLIYTDWGGAARAVMKTWKRGASVLGLIDLPPPLVDRTARVDFFGQPALFPPSLLELAQRSSIPVYVFIGQWDAQTLQPRLDVIAIKSGSAQQMLQQATTLLETAIHTRPGAWHAWGDAPLYFCTNFAQKK